MAKDYKIIKVFDPYVIAVLLTLRNGPMNLSELFRRIGKIAEVSMVTLMRKVKILHNYGLIRVAEKRKGPFSEEKRYKLSSRGKILADAFARVLS